MNELSPYSRTHVNAALARLSPDNRGAVVRYATTIGMKRGVFAKSQGEWVFVGNLDGECDWPWFAGAETQRAW